MSKEKTHWLQNPNKNYLGHWDLPNGEDVILTIASAGWEEVKNPIINTSEAKRVIRFSEKNDWIKPFICNEINAQTILKSTSEKFMEDCVGKKIRLGVGTARVKKEEVDCLRVRLVSSTTLSSGKINAEETKALEALLEEAKKDKIEFCQAMKINGLGELPKSKLEACIKRLTQMISENANNN